jgi:hypothetical protein
MTVRFRPVETNELVDDERVAQRIYMGSAMTMEPGEHARSLAPCRRSCLQHTSATPPTSAANHPAPSFGPSLSSSTARSTGSLVLVCRLFTSSCPTAMLETALFVSYSTIPVLLYQQDACLVVSVTLGIRLSFHVHDHRCARTTCTLHKPAAPFSLCISLPAAVRGRLLTCRSRNAAPAAASAAQRLRTIL